jgi:type IV pilus assembly protein PilB
MAIDPQRAAQLTQDSLNSGNPATPANPAGEVDRHAELEHTRRLAERYRLEFIDMDTFRIDQELFRSIPADLMLRYGFVPHRRDGKSLEIVVSDPTDLPMIDELAMLLATPIKVVVGSQSAIESISEEERELAARARGRHRELSAAAPEGRGERRREPDGRAADKRHQSRHPARRLDHLHRYPAACERHSHRDRRRCRAREASHRRRPAARDAADCEAVPQLDHLAHQGHGRARHREKRVPQDGRFRLRMPGKTIDFRVSIMPSVHGEDAVVRILTRSRSASSSPSCGWTFSGSRKPS